MKHLRIGILRALVFVLVFLLGTYLFFPYRTLAERAMHELKTKVQGELSYTISTASFWGVELKDIRYRHPSGGEILFRQGDLSLSWLLDRRAELSLLQSEAQEVEEGKIDLVLRSEKITINIHKLRVQTGRSDLGILDVKRGTLDYRFASGEGEGELDLHSDSFSVPLPIPPLAVDLSSKFTLQRLANGRDHQINNEISLVGADNTFSAQGPVTFVPVPGGTFQMEGELDFSSPMRSGKVQLGGTLAKPTWTVQPK